MVAGLRPGVSRFSGRGLEFFISGLLVRGGPASPEQRGRMGGDEKGCDRAARAPAASF